MLIYNVLFKQIIFMRLNKGTNQLPAPVQRNSYCKQNMYITYYIKTNMMLAYDQHIVQLIPLHKL